MKYRVVGWTYDDDRSVKYSGNSIGFAERNAIIDEIRKHKYLFSGRDHQERLNCVPVLNDGKKRSFSQRGWGGVMAEAYGELEDYAYAGYSFGIKEEYLNIPTDSFDPYEFIPEADLNEEFVVEVNEEEFNLIKAKNPFYMNDLDELRYLDAGDTLVVKSGENTFKFIVSDVGRSRNKFIGIHQHGFNITTPYKMLIKRKII